MKKILLTLLNFVCLNMIFGQSITFDYSTTSLGTSCNIFAPTATPPVPIVYQSYEHTTSFGFPYYSTTENSIVLQTKPISSTKDGMTQFAIKYAFKQGYTYKISFYCKATLGSAALSYPSIATFWGDDNGGLNNSTTCTGPVSKDHPATYGSSVVGASFAQTPNILDGVATAPHSYLWGLLSHH